jgi:hypothetical protein
MPIQRLNLRCGCWGHHYLEVTQWDDVADEVLVSFIGESSSLLQMLQWWWNHRKAWFNDIVLSREEVQKLIQQLNNPVIEK